MKTNHSVYKKLSTLWISGFTLIETVISIVISLIISISIYQIYHVQHNSYLIQQQIAEAQQRLRGSMDFLVSNLQMVGYDPTGISGAGLVTDFPEPNDIFSDDIDYAINKDIIAFTVDNNGDGIIQANDDEHIAYRLRDHVLERYKTTAGAWELIATDIDALNFVYFDAAGNVTNTLSEIRAVEITLLARSKNPDYRFVDSTTYYNAQSQIIFSPNENDHYRRRVLITRVQCRNLSI
jgi:type II secretory pathway component PulJ